MSADRMTAPVGRSKHNGAPKKGTGKRPHVSISDLYDENYHRLVLTKTMVQDMLDECMGSSVNLKRCLEKLVPPVIRVVKRPAAFVSRW